MKILYITQLFPFDPLNKNTSGVLRETVEVWSHFGHKIEVIRPHFKYEKESFPPNDCFQLNKNIKVKYVKPIRIPVLKFSFYNLNKIIKDLDIVPDVIICELYNSYFTFWRLSKLLKVPLVISLHMSDIKIAKNAFYRWHQKIIFKRTDAIACRSYAIKLIFDQYFRGYEEKTFTALLGLPDNWLSIVDKVSPDNYDRDVLRLVSVCRLIKLKHIDRVLLALSKLPNQIKWSYCIVGDGPEMKKLQQLSIQLKIMSNVKFFGMLSRERVMNILQKTDVFIMPSYPETFGLAFLEAMATGNIIIGTKGWGIDGVVIDGKNGFLCDASDIKSIMEKITQVSDLTSDERTRLILRSLETVKSFSIVTKSNEYLNEIIKRIHQEKK